MKVKIKKVYYCDFCGKHYLRPITDHENRCTANPNRHCNLCGTPNIKEIIDKYDKAYYFRTKKVGEYASIQVVWRRKFTLEDIKCAVDFCPNCILTILRCCKLNVFPLSSHGFYFNYKKELDEWWKEKNREREDY